MSCTPGRLCKLFSNDSFNFSLPFPDAAGFPKVGRDLFIISGGHKGSRADR